MTALPTALHQGLQQLGLALDEPQIQRLLQYLGLIQKWNQVYNLTALRSPAEMLTHHLLDSLAVIPALHQQLEKLFAPGRNNDRSAAPHPLNLRLLDVGCGAGLPGVVIAICCPHISVHCVDARAKKAAFVQQVANVLKLPNLCASHARVETIDLKYQIIVARAFASLADFSHYSMQALAEDGIWIAMKGRLPSEEIAALAPDVEVFHVEQLLVPGLDAQRCLVWLHPQHRMLASGG